MFSISAQPIAPEQLKSQLTNPGAGALVTFEGWVRNHNEGRQTVDLTYEAYAPLCAKEAAKIFAEATERFDLLEAHCVHRTGTLAIGEVAVWVGVVAAHRGDAFGACRYIIDAIKHRLPIWKKETYAGGESEWVNCTHRATLSAAK